MSKGDAAFFPGPRAKKRGFAARFPEKPMQIPGGL